jgi:hypothetical protein
MMSDQKPSDGWVRVFPGPRIYEVLGYVQSTWARLRREYPHEVSYVHDEPILTDNLCEALDDDDSRQASGMPCRFQSENWELRRDATGKVRRLARADITVTLGVSGTPQLVIEFKKLDGTSGARWQYCFSGMSRFVDGSYSVGHDFAVMCGLSCVALEEEDKAMERYVAKVTHLKRLGYVAGPTGVFVTRPSPTAPGAARFDTVHARPSQNPPKNIVLLHMLMDCPMPA